MGMGYWCLNCFTSRGKASKEEEQEEEEEGNKHQHEQGNVISHLPDQEEEEEEGNKHQHEQGDVISHLPDQEEEEEEGEEGNKHQHEQGDVISHLPDQEEEEEGNKHHHEQGNIISHLLDQSIDVPADRISGDLFSRSSEREEIKIHEKLSSTISNDRISDLPDDVLLLILSFLPSKAIGRTSVLSRRWSHVWSSYPILDFSELLSGNEAAHRQMSARIINTVLACLVQSNFVFDQCYKVSLTKGSIDCFQRVRGDPDNSCLARVEELVLDVSFSSSANTSRLPQCQLKSHSISSSRLSSKAWLGFPSTYVVSSYILSLQDLTLNEMDFSGMDLLSVSSFPFLEKLKLYRCRGMTSLNICCPNLKDIQVWSMKLYSMQISGMRLETLYFYGNCIRDRVNISAPNLQSLDWGNYIANKCAIHNFPTPKRYRMRHDLFGGTRFKTTRHSLVIDLLSYSSQAEILELSHDYYLEILSEIYLESGGLPFSFGKLKTLRMSGEMRQRHLGGLACLLKSSPVVHTLDLWFSQEEEHKWNNDLLETLIPFLIRLKVVNIHLGKIISENAITFAKIMLKYGTDLENIILKFWRSGSALPPNALVDTIALLNGFPRASINAKLSTYCY
ncbi:putative F-box/FBD/LRR-repeat protein At4g03220 [Argentina anserina]|uniref:putative F-box/FBD/LRR-repeat protein At4g03220 n=1 Tax=Argentina anserina TaxID=57926 RepID=UPI0021768FE4|nr:putative F-box/FBD/LRR-repeat protein At4g03220 [Potentilla anserina]